VHALLRRVEKASILAASGPIRLGDIVLEPSTRRVLQGETEIHLTPTEFDLLAFLGARPGQVFARERLLADVWGYGDGSGARTVDSHVRSLRRKLGADVVRTVHGVGYAAGDLAGSRA
jgi:DNA-binding response OmpR family regulator